MLLSAASEKACHCHVRIFKEAKKTHSPESMGSSGMAEGEILYSHRVSFTAQGQGGTW